MVGLTKFYSMKIDDVDMLVKMILKDFNRKSVDGVLLYDDSVYCFSAYSLVEFNGYKYRMADNSEKVWGTSKTVIQPMFKDIWVCVGMPTNKLTYQGKKYDMYNETEVEVLYQKLSTDLALECL